MNKETYKNLLTLFENSIYNTVLVVKKIFYYLLLKVNIKTNEMLVCFHDKTLSTNIANAPLIHGSVKNNLYQPCMLFDGRTSSVVYNETGIVDKNYKTRSFHRKFKFRTEFNENNKAKKYRLLPNSILNTYLKGQEYDMFVRVNMIHDKLYDFYVYRVGNHDHEVYYAFKAKADTVYNAMEKFNINPFN